MAARVHKARVFEGHKCTTGIHNALLDVVMPELSANTWKLLCVLIRQTTGWDREEQGASYSTLMAGTGIKSRATIAACLKELEEYRYPLITVQPGRQHEESRYTVNRDVEIDWVPQNFAYSSSSKIEPLRQSSSSKNEPLSSSENELLKQSSSSKIELSYMKESINLKEREKAAPPKNKSIASILMTAYENIASTVRDEADLRNQIIALDTESTKASDVEDWLASRNSLSSINFIARDFKTWCENRRRKSSAQVIASASKAITAPADYAAFYSEK